MIVQLGFHMQEKFANFSEPYMASNKLHAFGIAELTISFKNLVFSGAMKILTFTIVNKTINSV